MTEMDWRVAYIAGLVDNHCGIVVTVGKDTDRAIGYRVGVECRIKIRSEESLSLLTDYCDATNIAYRTKTNKDHTYNSYELVIGRRGAVKTFLEEVQPYLVARDTAVELLCTTIIPRLEAGDHRERASFLDLLDVIETFREQVGRANRTKYDLEYFHNEWNIDEN